MPAFSTAVTCFLCNAQVHLPPSLQCHDISAPKVPYKSEDKSKLMAHLKTEHGASQGMDYLMAGCTMSKEERIAIQVWSISTWSNTWLSDRPNFALQNVVGGRQPKLIHLAPEESDEEADEPEVEAITMMLIHTGSEMTRRLIWSPKLTLGSK